MEKEENKIVKVDRDTELKRWEHGRIIVHRATLNRMMHIGRKDFPEMLTLYFFYYEKARRDRTNQPWALDKYCMKGLGWSKDRFYRIKKKLLAHDFIEQIKVRDEKGKFRSGEKGKAGAFYIKVNYMSTHCPEKPDSGKIGHKCFKI